jgi:hypothetical protein
MSVCGNKMPVTYFIDTTKRLIHTVCAGPVCLEDVIDHFTALKNDPACVGSLDVLLDVNSVDSAPESNQLRVVGSQIAAFDKRFNSNCVQSLPSATPCTE